MSGTTRNGHHEHRGHLTGETLRRLIDEGDALRPSDDDPAPSTDLPRPSDAALGNLATTLRVAATPATCQTEDRAAREAAAVAAFRAATATTRHGPTGTGTVHEQRRARLRRARRTLVFSIAAAVLGGGVAVAAGGGIPFVGSSPGHGTGHPAPGTTVTPSPTTPAQETDLPARPTAGPDGPATSPVQGSDEPSAPASQGGILGANEPALRAHCDAHARNPHLTPRPLVVAAGGQDQVPAFCATLLSAPRPTPDRDNPTAAAQQTRRPSTPPTGRQNPSTTDGPGQGGEGEQGNSGDTPGKHGGKARAGAPS